MFLLLNDFKHSLVPASCAPKSADPLPRTWQIGLCFSFWLLLGLTATAADRQDGTEIVVTTFEDRLDPSDGVTSLREAIDEARSRGGDQLIRLGAGTYSVSSHGTDETADDTAADRSGGDSKSKRPLRLTIQGAGAADTVLSAANGGRFYSVGPGETLRVVAATLTGGVAPLDPNGRGYGGAILNTGGTVEIIECILAENSAKNEGGAIYSIDWVEDNRHYPAHVFVRGSVFSENGSYDGGAIYSSGDECTVTILGTMVNDNTAGRKGGGVLFFGNGALEINDCLFSDNTSEAFDGGAVECDYGDDEAQISIVDSDFLGNTAGGHGGVFAFQRGATCDLTGCTFSENMCGGSGGVISGVHNTLTMTDCTFSQNHANADIGAIKVSDLEMTLSGCTITENSAVRFAGGINATRCVTTISNCSITDNECGNTAGLSGGGVANTLGTMTIRDSTISRNRAGFNGGGISNGGNSVAPGVMSLTNCVIAENHGPAGGGGIANGDQGQLTITDCTITGNTTDNYGGGIQSVFSIETVVTNSTISGNSGFGGGGINNGGGSRTVLMDCEVANNTSTGEPSSLFPGGGGIVNGEGSEVEIYRSTISGNRANFQAGGIRNAGTLTIEESTLSENSAAREGGGIFNWRQGEAQITNSTLSQNESRDGGGLFNQDSGGRIIFAHCTLTGNSANVDDDGGVGGGIRMSNGMALLHNTIVAGNTRGSSATSDDITNSNGSLEAASSYNLIGDPDTAGGLTHGQNGNIVGTGSGGQLNISSILNTGLANNGGPTRTHVLVAGSPALNAGTPDFSSPDILYDQRGEGFPRILDGRLDIGAIEIDEDTDPPPDCLVESATKAMGIPAPLDLLRSFRDEVLALTRDGRRLKSLYYAHSPEMIRIVSHRPLLAARSLEVLLQTVPAIEASRSNGRVCLDHDLHAQICSLLRECRMHAGPELSAAIDEVEGLLASRTRSFGRAVVIDFGRVTPVVSRVPSRWEPPLEF